jgi:anaerobic selenocysteine-containing dehydrogenase
MDRSNQCSRRQLLKAAALLTGAALTAGLGARHARAQQKVPKESVKYQDKPNAEKKCSNCAQFVAPNGCKVVDGTISPNGYCAVWAKKQS